MAEVINSSESVDVAMAALDELMHPEIEYVNPEDAIEASSGAEAVGPPVAAIYTIRDGRMILRIEWHYDLDEAVARFERDGDV